MDYNERMATDIGLVMQNEYHMQRHIESYAMRHTQGELSNELAELYYSRITACLDVLEEATRQYILDCSIQHSVVLNDGLMLIREICLNLGYSVFDSLAADYQELFPASMDRCLDCEKPIPCKLSVCIECQTAKDGPVGVFDLA